LTVTRDASRARPRPKCSRKSFCEQKLPPLRTSRICCRPSHSTTTLDPIAARLVRVPINLTSSHEFVEGDRFRSKVGGSFKLLITTSTCPVLKMSPKAAPRLQRESSRPAPLCSEMSSKRPFPILRYRIFLPSSSFGFGRFPFRPGG